MTSAVMEEVRPLTQELEDEYDEYYAEDWDLYHSEKFAKEMEEVIAEYEDIIAHPEKYKAYTSIKEMFRDMGFDVSNFGADEY